MNIHQLLLRLYPYAWRARYEEEVLAVLASRPLSLREAIDVLRGAVDAHLHPYLGTADLSLAQKRILLLSSLRRSLLTMFCTYSAFIVAGIAFQKLTEDHDFVEAAQAHSLVGLSLDLVVIGAIVALLAVLTGGLPIVAAVVKDAFTRKRYGLLFLLVTPAIALTVFISTTLLLEALAPVGTSLLYRGIFLAVFLSAAVASTGAVCWVVARSEISARLLRFAVLPSLLMTLAMLVMLIATLIWGLSLHSSVPQLFQSNEGMFGTSTSGSWLRIVLTMAVATGLAAFSLMQGFSVRSALRPTIV